MHRFIEVLVDPQGRGAVDSPLLDVGDDVELVWICRQAGVGPLRLHAVDGRGDDDIEFLPFVPTAPEALPAPVDRQDGFTLEASAQTVVVISWQAPRAQRARSWVYRIVAEDAPVDSRDFATGVIHLSASASTAGSGGVSEPR
ncbi:hypothetical protein E5843_06125 [Luteimonas yindakuii]|uniref:hypothetical protein n=1 Tax=Luteimonas yindakuii TaxID=2565782 RepID=UPI0010A35BD4|nr:hypothetical protein [Luteimonas yindakuii]QCO67456.1 hypothetical protein E5843_06125 [Luteimonas yindakuii]